MFYEIVIDKHPANTLLGVYFFGYTPSYSLWVNAWLPTASDTIFFLPDKESFVSDTLHPENRSYFQSVTTLRYNHLTSFHQPSNGLTLLLIHFDLNVIHLFK